MHDILYGARTLKKSPGFALVTIISMGLCIGLTSVVFMLVNGVLWQPLPYPESDRLFILSTANPAQGTTGFPMSYTKFQAIQQHARSIATVGAYFPTNVSLAINGTVEELTAAKATASLFQALRVAPVLGRNFLPKEEENGGTDVVIVTDHFWRTRLGSSRHVLGRIITLDGKNTEVIGVLPANFHFPFQQPAPEIWLPRVFEFPLISQDRIRSGASFLGVFARTQPGTGEAQARAEMDALAKAYEKDSPGFADAQGFIIEVKPLKETVIGQVRPTLFMVATAVLFLWLTGCSNVAGLLAARASSRRKDIAVRQALGASWARIARQFVVENLALAVLSCILGMAIAFASGAWLRSLPPGTVPRIEEQHVASSTTFIAVALSVFSTLFFGLLPLLDIYQPAIMSWLKEGGRSSGSGRKGNRLRVFLVVGQVATALVLVLSAGLLLRSFSKLSHIRPGFDPAQSVAITLDLPKERYKTPQQQAQFYRELQSQIENLPGVSAVGAISSLPIAGVAHQVYVCPEGTVCQGIGKDPVMALRQSTPGYLNAMRIQLIAGRDLDKHDTATSPRVALINQAAASRLFSQQNPVGKKLLLSRDKIALEIVGVVADVRFNGLGSPVTEEFYVPIEQSPVASMTIVVRSPSKPESVVPVVRRILARMDPGLPFVDVSTLETVLSNSVTQPRIAAGLTAAFASAALFLASLGIYGVITLWVTERTSEIGIRLAMGAARPAIVSMLLREGMTLVCIGMSVGGVAAILLAPLLKTLLFGISAYDPETIIAVAVLLVFTSLLSVLIPARRSLSIDPIIVLR